MKISDWLGILGVVATLIAVPLGRILNRRLAKLRFVPPTRTVQVITEGEAEIEWYTVQNLHRALSRTNAGAERRQNIRIALGQTSGESLDIFIMRRGRQDTTPLAVQRIRASDKLHLHNWGKQVAFIRRAEIHQVGVKGLVFDSTLGNITHDVQIKLIEPTEQIEPTGQISIAPQGDAVFRYSVKIGVKPDGSSGLLTKAEHEYKLASCLLRCLQHGIKVQFTVVLPRAGKWRGLHHKVSLTIMLRTFQQPTYPDVDKLLSEATRVEEYINKTWAQQEEEEREVNRTRFRAHFHAPNSSIWQLYTDFDNACRARGMFISDQGGPPYPITAPGGFSEARLTHDNEQLRMLLPKPLPNRAGCWDSIADLIRPLSEAEVEEYRQSSGLMHPISYSVGRHDIERVVGTLSSNPVDSGRKFNSGRRLSAAEAAHAISVTQGTLKGYIRQGRIHQNPDGTIDTYELQRAGFIIRN
jgi:hypothetical protein